MRADGPNLTLAHPEAIARAGEALRAARRRGGAALDHEADRLSLHDARRVLAVAAFTALEGGRAAVLRPVRRRRLNQLAARLGLRAFDASLIIAIAQDAARHGERAESAAVVDRLSLVGPAHASGGTMRGPGRWAWAIATLAGLALAAAGIGWIALG